MGAHDEYEKRVLLEATAGAVDQYGPGVEIDYGTEFPARIDGVVGGSIAIEIESRTGKQVRGAVVPPFYLIRATNGFFAACGDALFTAKEARCFPEMAFGIVYLLSATL